jgi:AcrR family transcriptional regulator
MSAKARSTRDELCEAAIRTAGRDGILSMTLDNVAREAGVSKGGVMYHFPSKDHLVRAMIEHFGAKLEEAMLRRIADDPEPRGRWARALLHMVFPADEAVPPSSDGGALFQPEMVDKFLLATLAAAVNNPGLIEPLRSMAKRMQQRFLAESNGGVDQLLVWLAVDGLFLWQFIGLIDRDDPLFRRVCEELRRKVAADAEILQAVPEAPPPRKPRVAKPGATKPRARRPRKALAVEDRS